VKVISTGVKQGFRIVNVVIYPLRYIPSQGVLYLYTNIHFRLRYKRNAVIPMGINPRHKDMFIKKIKSLVKNPEDVERFSPPEASRFRSKALSPDTVDYVIITDNTTDSAYWEPLRYWKTKKGVPARIVTLNYIYANYTGDDNPDKIRNFIKDAKDTWGTLWFLLAGQCDFENGEEIIPRRDVYCMTSGANNYSDEDTIPSDLYYANLDGTWDANGNGTYGEDDDNVDLYHDVCVGRAPVKNTSQIKNFVNKVLNYEKNPPATNFAKKILLPAVMLFSYYNWGGDHVNDAVANIVPSGWEKAKLYDLNNSPTWDLHGAVIDSTNTGFGFIHHADHGNENGHYYYYGDVVYDASDADAARNGIGNGYSIMTSISCFCGAVDEVSGGDCVAEHFVNRADSGGVADIANSRYGWGSSSGMGPSEILDTTFYHEIFYNNDYHIGDALLDMKDALAGVASSNKYYRWCVYETNLFGDPEMPMWTNDPRTLSVEHPSAIELGTSTFTVIVKDKDGNTPLQDALVCLWKKVATDDEVYEVQYTNANGEATFVVSPSTCGDMYVTVTKHNYKPYEGEVSVVELLPPTNLNASIIQKDPPVVHITWNDNSQHETEYVLVRADVGNDSAGPGNWPWSIYLPANTTSFIDSSITGTSKNYYYEVVGYVIVDGVKHWSAYSNPDTVYFDTKAPTVSITNPSNNAVLYTGNNTISWNATDEGGIASETLYYPYNQKVVLSGDTRSRLVNLTCRDKGGEYQVKAIAVDSAGNRGVSSRTIVVVDKSKADINLSDTLLDNNQVRINSDLYFNRLYSRHSNDVWKIIFDQENHPLRSYTDPDPLDGENESATYFACRYNSSDIDSFYHVSEKITAAKPVQCPLLYVYTDSGYILDNSLLPRSEYIRENYLDRYRINIRPFSDDGILRFMITDNKDITYIDQIRLLIVDHLKGIEVGLLPDGRIIPYTETDNPFRAVDNRGIDYTDSVRTRGKGQWRGEKNGWLLVNTSPEDTGYVITRAEEPKIPVEAAGLNIYTRSNPEDIIIPYQDSLIKYIPVESLVGIDYISVVDRKQNTPLREKFAGIESLPDEAIHNDNVYYEITPGDTLYFSFKNPGKTAWFKRDYILLTKGYYTDKKGKSPLSMVTRVTYKNDTRIIRSLGRSIIIEFESEGNRDIRLKVYDIAGRIIKDKRITLSAGIKRYSIDNLPQGIYFIKVNKRIYKGVIVR